MMTETVDIQTRDDIRFGPLSASLGFLLRLLQLVSFQDFYARFANSDIRPGEISVLILIDENPGIRQGVLARRLLIKRAHMTKMVQAFEAAGLVTKSVPKDDKRGIELHLTPKGQRHVNKVKPTFIEHEAVTRHGLSPREEAELKRLLRKALAIPEAGGRR
jgi:DNA-binding MarR family transcriptional regulator